MSFDAGSTPPQEPPSISGGQQPVFQLSLWIRRAGASMIDGVLWFAIWYIGGGIIGGNSAALSLLFTLAATVFWFWQLWQQGVTGQTIGKKALGIKLVSETNAQIVGGWYSIGRAFVHIVDFPCLLGYVWPLWDPKRQTFADKIMKTVVIDV